MGRASNGPPPFINRRYLMEDLKKILGVVMPFQMGEHKVDLYPIRVKDWPEFSANVVALTLERLQDIFKFADGYDRLIKCIGIITRKDPIHEMFYDMTQADYTRFRDVVISQNDLDFVGSNQSDSPKGKK